MRVGCTVRSNLTTGDKNFGEVYIEIDFEEELINKTSLQELTTIYILAIHKLAGVEKLPPVNVSDNRNLN